MLLFGSVFVYFGECGCVVIDFIDGLMWVLFGIVYIVMKLVLIGVFGVMVFMIGKYGVGLLVLLFKLIGMFYLMLVVFVFVVFGVIVCFIGFLIICFVLYIKEELLIVFGMSLLEVVLL